MDHNPTCYEPVALSHGLAVRMHCPCKSTLVQVSTGAAKKIPHCLTGYLLQFFQAWKLYYNTLSINRPCALRAIACLLTTVHLACFLASSPHTAGADSALCVTLVFAALLEWPKGSIIPLQGNHGELASTV